MTLPGFRTAHHRRVRRHGFWRFLSAYLIRGLEGHCNPDLYSPTAVNIEPRSRQPWRTGVIWFAASRVTPNGMFARWVIKVMEMAAEISRRSDLPLYVDFGTLWGPPESGANSKPSVRSSNGSFRSFVKVMCLPIR